MKRFDWKSFLKQHPIFKCLSEDDINQLLKDEASEERVCLKDSVIIREGEVENSVFLIGTGSIRVALQVKDSYEINLSVLKKGNFFGEMALIEEKPRSATVIAQEDSTLLEVKGKEFSKIIENYPEIAFKVLLKLSERLRGNERLMTMKLKDADEKINLFNTKLDAELKAVDASMKASLTIFDQTKMRTDEVISSTERSSARLKTIASAVGGFAAVVISIFTWFGIGKFQDITEKFQYFTGMETKFEKINKNITDDAAAVKTKLQDIKEIEQDILLKAKSISESAIKVENLDEITKTVKRIAAETARFSVLPKVRNALDEGDSIVASEYYKQLLQLDDPKLTSDLLFEIELRIVLEEEKDLKMYQDLLAMSVNYINTPREKIIAYYLRLTVLILNDEHKEIKYKVTFSDFKNYVKNRKGLNINKDESLVDIDEIFEKKDQEKQDLWFEHVRPLIP